MILGRRAFLKGLAGVAGLLALGPRWPTVVAPAVVPVTTAESAPIFWDPLADGQWHQLAVTCARGEVKRHVDGVLCELELPMDVKVDWKDGPVRFVGLPDDYTAQWAQRRIGEPHLYDRAASGHYQRFSTQFDDLAIYDHAVDDIQMFWNAS